jgi:hypothetical protein
MPDAEQPLRYVDFDGKIREVSAAVLDNLDDYIPQEASAASERELN